MLTTRLLSCVLVGSSLVGCAKQSNGSASAAAASGAEAGGPSVTLTFAWPAGPKVSVTDRTTVDDGSERKEMRASWQLSVEREGEGLKVVPSNVSSEMANAAPADPSDPMASLLPTVLASSIPTMVLTNTGSVQSLEVDSATLEKKIIAAFEKEPDKEKREMMQGLAMGMFGAAVHSAKGDIARAFTETTSHWAGLTLVQGQTNELDESYALGMMGEVPVHTKLTFLGTVPCDPEAQEARCAKLRLESELRSPSGAGPMKVTRLHHEREIVAEMATLLPRSTTFRTELTTHVDMGGEGVDATQRSEGERTFAYAGQ